MTFHLYIYISKNIKFQSTSKDYFLSSPLSYCYFLSLYLFTCWWNERWWWNCDFYRAIEYWGNERGRYRVRVPLYARMNRNSPACNVLFYYELHTRFIRARVHTCLAKRWRDFERQRQNRRHSESWLNGCSFSDEDTKLARSYSIAKNKKKKRKKEKREKKKKEEKRRRREGKNAPIRIKNSLHRGRYMGRESRSFEGSCKAFEFLNSLIERHFIHFLPPPPLLLRETKFSKIYKLLEDF